MEPAVFNKAALTNVGYKEAKATANFDCYIFHDVDMLPEDDHNFYTCSELPRHMSARVDKWNYTLPYAAIFGGIQAFRPVHYELVNGFSNQFYGWGGEDDDMFSRLKAKKLKIVRFSKHVARYSMIKHERDAGNPYNTRSIRAWQSQPRQYETDGLNSLKYDINSSEQRPLYAWILVTLPPDPFHKEHQSDSNSTKSDESPAEPRAVHLYPRRLRRRSLGVSVHTLRVHPWLTVATLLLAVVVGIVCRTGV